jgi:hypothetical protein
MTSTPVTKAPLVVNLDSFQREPRDVAERKADFYRCLRNINEARFAIVTARKYAIPGSPLYRRLDHIWQEITDLEFEESTESTD